MTDGYKLPHDLHAFARLLDDQPEDGQALFRYALTRLMREDGKAKMVERHHVDNLETLTIETSGIIVLREDFLPVPSRVEQMDLTGNKNVLPQWEHNPY